MKVYIDPEHIDEYIDKSITQQLKEANSCVNEIDLHDKSISENKEDFYKKIMEIIEKVQKAINKHRRNEQDGILVGSNGQLLQIYGNATIHDWVVWHIKEYKKGKL
jgi:adenylosuccinate synthase